MNPHFRLKSWGRWLHDHPLNCHPAVTVIWRLMHEGAGASADSSAQSDGGMVSLMTRIGGMIRYNTRCVETHEAIGAMSQEHRALVYATYTVPSRRDRPRGRRCAAELLKITEAEYRERRAAMLDWLESWLVRGPIIPDYAPKVGSTCRKEG